MPGWLGVGEADKARDVACTHAGTMAGIWMLPSCESDDMDRHMGNRCEQESIWGAG